MIQPEHRFYNGEKLWTIINEAPVEFIVHEIQFGLDTIKFYRNDVPINKFFTQCAPSLEELLEDIKNRSISLND